MPTHDQDRVLRVLVCLVICEGTCTRTRDTRHPRPTSHSNRRAESNRVHGRRMDVGRATQPATGPHSAVLSGHWRWRAAVGPLDRSGLRARASTLPHVPCQDVSETRVERGGWHWPLRLLRPWQFQLANFQGSKTKLQVDYIRSKLRVWGVGCGGLYGGCGGGLQNTFLNLHECQAQRFL